MIGFRLRLYAAGMCAAFAAAGALLLLFTSGTGAALANLGFWSLLGLLILPS